MLLWSEKFAIAEGEVEKWNDDYYLFSEDYEWVQFERAQCVGRAGKNKDAEVGLRNDQSGWVLERMHGVQVNPERSCFY